ncbi:MAG: hypothetical protein JOZ86_15735 [Candidatus Eremiobacteraeota bacterium]|nr:hypothetical protein [Candidatus Eremiobacteraeota bacterium]
MIAPMEVRYDEEVDVLCVRYARAKRLRTVFVDPDGEIMADLAHDGSVLFLELLYVGSEQRMALDAFAQAHDLVLPPEVDTFQRSCAAGMKVAG